MPGPPDEKPQVERWKEPHLVSDARLGAMGANFLFIGLAFPLDRSFDAMIAVWSLVIAFPLLLGSHALAALGAREGVEPGRTYSWFSVLGFSGTLGGYLSLVMTWSYTLVFVFIALFAAVASIVGRKMTSLAKLT